MVVPWTYLYPPYFITFRVGILANLGINVQYQAMVQSL